MNRFFAIALLAVAAYLAPVTPAAHAQGCGSANPNCLVPMAPNGDNSNRAASTAWVQANGAGSAVTSVFTRTGAVVAAANDYSFSQIAGVLALGQMPAAAANSLYGNLVLNTPTTFAVPSCSSASNALTWTTGTGFGCNTISTSLSSIPADNLLGNPTAAPAVPTNVPLLNCVGGANALNYSTSTHLFSCLTITAGSATTITVASTTVASGTAGRVLFDNGTLGEYAISGTGSVAMTTSPTFTTPTLGVATATTINKVTLTAPATGSTLTIADGKTLTVSNTHTETATDGATIAFGGGGTVTYTIQSGTAALGTSAIASAACATAVTVSATGVATTDAIIVSFNGDPTAVTGYVPLTTGMLTIIPYPTLNNVNFKVCNNTNASITPGAITLNWRVVR